MAVRGSLGMRDANDALDFVADRVAARPSRMPMADFGARLQGLGRMGIVTVIVIVIVIPRA
jgi:hypothetical protein